MITVGGHFSDTSSTHRVLYTRVTFTYNTYVVPAKYVAYTRYMYSALSTLSCLMVLATGYHYVTALVSYKPQPRVGVPYAP